MFFSFFLWNRILFMKAWVPFTLSVRLGVFFLYIVKINGFAARETPNQRSLLSGCDYLWWVFVLWYRFGLGQKWAYLMGNMAW